MIKIKDLNKSYGNVEVYKNFNLEVRDSEVLCILGESGCGKTTLLNCIANLTEYDGQITNAKCAYIFQKPRLVPNLSVYENLKLVCPDEKKVDKILERVKLWNRASAYPVELSGGEARRVSIARAFLYSADVILMDEPFSSLDLKIKYEMFALFKDMKAEFNSTAIFVTHDVEEAIMLSDRIIVLDKGKIKADIEVKSATQSELRKKLIATLLGNRYIS